MISVMDWMFVSLQNLFIETWFPVWQHLEVGPSDGDWIMSTEPSRIALVPL